MGRITDEEREALRLAAVAAVPILAKLEREYAELGRRIAVHKGTIAEYEASLGRRPKNPIGVPTEGTNGKTPRGRVVEQIDTIFSEPAATGLTEPALRARIKERFGAIYSRASVYSALRRGLQTGKYEMRSDNTWWKKGVRLVVG